MGDPRTKVRLTLNENFNGFWPFFCESTKFIFSIFVEYLGYSIVAYIVALLHDKSALSAFGSMDNFLAILFCIGLGVGDIVKSNVGLLIGEEKLVQAKNSANYYKIISI